MTPVILPKKRRRILNPRSWWKRWVFGDTDVDRRLLCALANVAKEYGAGTRVYIRSGRRTRTEQRVLYEKYLRDGWPIAARPGTSRHESGRAADCALIYVNGQAQDIGTDARARELLRKRDLSLPVRGESWHVEMGAA